MFYKYLITSCSSLTSLTIKIFNINLLNVFLIFYFKAILQFIDKVQKNKFRNVRRLKLFIFLKYYVITKLQKQREKLS